MGPGAARALRGGEAARALRGGEAARALRGGGAARALRGGGAVELALHPGGAVELALHPGGYVKLAGGWVLIATPRAPRGPLSLLVSGLEARPLAPGDEAWVDDALHVGPHTIPLDLAPAATPAKRSLCPGWRAALGAALDACAAPPAELAEGIATLQRGDLAAAVAALAGRGEGLTPVGDDVLAGYAAWRHAGRRDEAVAGDAAAAPSLAALAAARASPIGLAYLRCAERGEVPEVVARLLQAIRAGNAGLARRRAGALSRWGASSGAAMLWGVASAT
jgi:hypothetical protein